MTCGIQVRLLLLALISFAALLAGCGSSSPRSETALPSAQPTVTTLPVRLTPSFQTLSGLLTSTDQDGVSHSTMFTCDASGDWSLRLAPAGVEGEPGGTVLVEKVYDARQHVLLATYRKPSGRLVSELSSFWPKEGPLGDSETPLDLGEAWIVSAALSGDPALVVQPMVVDGRPALQVTFTRLLGVEGQTVTVDQGTGLPVAWSVPDQEDATVAGAGGFSGSLTGLRIDEPLSPQVFSTRPPADARVRTYVKAADYYCRLDEVAARVGFRPFVATSIPRGYRLFEVATDQRSAGDYVGGCSCWTIGHEPHLTEFLRYRRRGLEAFTLQVAAVSRAERRGVLRNLRPLPGYAVESQTLAQGPFAGGSATTWFDRNGANLIVVGERYVAFITGTLTRQQLYRVAEGLRQR